MTNYSVWPSVPASPRADHVRAIVSEIKRAALTDQEMSKVLALGQLYGRLLWVNSVGIYRDDAFEERLMSLVGSRISPVAQVPSERILHVVSTPYDAGGHTRLMERLCRFEPELSDVLVSRPYRRDRKSLRLPPDAAVHHSEHGYDLAGLVHVISKYRIICLHIHPDDLLAAAAVGISKRQTGARVIFVNHADHVFSFGFHSTDIVAEISTFGLTLSHVRRQLPSAFMGIALDSYSFPPTARSAVSQQHIISAAAPHKFRPANGYSFPSLTVEILKAMPGSTLTVIGPKLSNRWWWWAKLQFPRRLRLYPVLPYDRYLDLISRADIYIDSLPMTGGTALPEIRAKGVAVTGLWTGALGYTPFDQTKLASREILLTELERFFCGDGGHIASTNNMTSLIAQARVAHSIDEVGSRFRAIIAGHDVLMPDISATNHDHGFYERLWQEERVFNLDRKARREVLALAADGNAALLRHLLGVAVGWQKVRLLFAYIVLLARRLS
ncbi:hypothetical protein [Paraperlucidibaca sp.]|jgi:hypothetical protein|uniref:hypothetical protein n=1 Tax=Paraperlucidibaca sp. TaxID=2708021 RepID=UPI0039896CDE|tara:strand:- start:1533 stop:3026 length:1494 start_codon:yes stop_codon:yes gene_type:complete